MWHVDQIESMLERPTHGQRGRRVQTDEGAEACAHGFVNQFEAATAGDHDEAFSSIDGVDLHRADQLDEGVVAADVFAAQQRFTVDVEIQRGVQSTLLRASC